MNRSFSAIRTCLPALLFAIAMASKALGDDVPPPPPPDPNGAAAAPDAGAAQDPNVEVMTRGPVHEAYAVPVSTGQATAGLIVQRQPPAAVEEAPPDMKPEGDNASWIPGYWSWDDDRKDFIWVSGVWRIPPPGFRWMPGYWQDAQGQGHQWISGYWMPAQVEQTSFMPQPPESMESGPNVPQPDQNHFWVAGHQQWHETRYVWSPGYWAVRQPDWIWVPATYNWCPSGWVYVPGYWDYPLARRGIVFSPVYFARPVAYYRPAVCIDVGVLSFSLFCRPSYCHYYFGDYYDDRYVALGIRPWYYYHTPGHGYDPLYGYYRWYHEDHMGEHEWGHHLVGWHDYYRSHPDMRPPHTLSEEHRLIASGAMQHRPGPTFMAHDIHHLDAHMAGAMRVQAVSREEHAHITQVARETRNFQQERQQFEHQTAAGAHGPSQPVKANFAQMQGFKSNTLPGASAANINAAAKVNAMSHNGTGNPAANNNRAIGQPGGSNNAVRNVGPTVSQPNNTNTGRTTGTGQPSGNSNVIRSVGPATGQPTTGQPSGGQPSGNPNAVRNVGPSIQPGTGQPSTGQPGTGQPSKGQPSTGQPSGGQPSGGRGQNTNRGDNRGRSHDKEKDNGRN